MPDRNLLIISNNFPNEDNTNVGSIFVKDQLNHLKIHFNKIFVISPVAYGVERLRNQEYENYTFDNVKVFFPRYSEFSTVLLFWKRNVA